MTLKMKLPVFKDSMTGLEIRCDKLERELRTHINKTELALSSSSSVPSQSTAVQSAPIRTVPVLGSPLIDATDPDAVAKGPENQNDGLVAIEARLGRFEYVVTENSNV